MRHIKQSYYIETNYSWNSSVQETIVDITAEEVT